MLLFILVNNKCVSVGNTMFEFVSFRPTQFIFDLLTVAVQQEILQKFVNFIFVFIFSISRIPCAFILVLV